MLKLLLKIAMEITKFAAILQVLERMRPIEHRMKNYVEKLILHESDTTNSDSKVRLIFFGK